MIEVFFVLDQNQRIDLLEILEDRNGRGSTIVTSQVPVELWSEVIGDSMRRIRGKRSLDAATAN